MLLGHTRVPGYPLLGCRVPFPLYRKCHGEEILVRRAILRYHACKHQAPHILRGPAHYFPALLYDACCSCSRRADSADSGVAEGIHMCHYVAMYVPTSPFCDLFVQGCGCQWAILGDAGGAKGAGGKLGAGGASKPGAQHVRSFTVSPSMDHIVKLSSANSQESISSLEMGMSDADSMHFGSRHGGPLLPR